MLKQNEKWFYAIISQYKYLGIDFSSFQKWNLAHDTLANQGTKVLACAMEYHVQHTLI